MKAAVVIPAYNEASRLPQVLAALSEAEGFDELVVVNDGSSDNTGDVAREFAANCPRVRVVDYGANRGKGGAMRAGAMATEADVILFLDADLIGLKPEHPRMLLDPVLRGETDMSVGVFRGGRYATDLSHKVAAWVSGQRAMRREHFLEIPGVSHSRSGVETAITRYARSQRWRIHDIPLSGITHTMKEEKIGPLRGFAARMKMYWEIGKILLDGKSPNKDD